MQSFPIHLEQFSQVRQLWTFLILLVLLQETRRRSFASTQQPATQVNSPRMYFLHNALLIVPTPGVVGISTQGIPCYNILLQKTVIQRSFGMRKKRNGDLHSSLTKTTMPCLLHQTLSTGINYV